MSNADILTRISHDVGRVAALIETQTENHKNVIATLSDHEERIAEVEKLRLKITAIVLTVGTGVGLLSALVDWSVFKVALHLNQ